MKRLLAGFLLLPVCLFGQITVSPSGGVTNAANLQTTVDDLTASSGTKTLTGGHQAIGDITGNVTFAYSGFTDTGGTREYYGNLNFDISHTITLPANTFLSATADTATASVTFDAGNHTFSIIRVSSTKYILLTDQSDISGLFVIGTNTLVDIGAAASGANSDITSLSGLTSLTDSGDASVNSLTITGNQSAAAWTTNGLRIKGQAGTFTDTTSSGTVAAAYTNKLGGNTIAATSATTYTKYISLYISGPTAGTNVTITNPYALGADSAIFGTSTPLIISAAGALSGGSGYEVPLTFSSPLARSTNTISIPPATTSVDGYLTATNWNTFNGKQSSITLTTTGSSGAATFTSNTLNIPQYSGGGSPGGSNTQVQYNNSSAFGGISNATSDGTTLTLTSPKIVTAINDTNGNPLFNITATGSAIFGLNLTNAASAGTVDLQSTPPTQATAGIAGTPLKIHASDAVAGSGTAGAVGGGSITLQGGDAKRLTSGNGNGGNVILNAGNSIGGGTLGVINLQIAGTTYFRLDSGLNFSPATDNANDIGDSTHRVRNSYLVSIIGTTTNDSAGSGKVGESVSSLIASGSAVSLTTATAANVTSISLTAGDWDVGGNVNFSETTSTVTARSAGISSTSATVPTDGSEAYCGVQSTVTSETNTITLGRKRFSLSTTTTVYLVGSATFSAGTCSEFGSIYARRVR